MAKRITATQWSKWSFQGGSTWSRWRPLSERGVQAAPMCAGAYAIGLPAGRGIRRLLGDDAHGVLHIGEAGSLRERIDTFRVCVSQPGARGHMAGWRLGSLGLLEQLDVTPGELRITWCPATSKSAAYDLESALLRGYFELFGELPPLNYKSNWAAYVPE